MSKPKYTFIAAAIRDYYYKDFYDSVAVNNKIPFEIIFVGPNPPLEKMPDNFHYIKTHVKPNQCAEIAARNATGEYLIWTSDDLRYMDGFLNRLDQYNCRLDDDKIYIAFRATIQGHYVDAGLVYDLKKPLSPIIGFSGLFKKDIWHALGGLDKRFFGSYADVDMQLRFAEQGRTIFIPPDCIFNELKPRKQESKRTLLSYRCTVSQARPLLNLLWGEVNSTTSKRRLLPVQSFSDKNILIEDQ